VRPHGLAAGLPEDVPGGDLAAESLAVCVVEVWRGRSSASRGVRCHQEMK